MNIEKYTARGKTKYRFFAYLGIDDLTGKEIRVRRSGFDTKKEAEIAYLKLLHDREEESAGRQRFDEVLKSWLNIYEPTVKESTYNKTSELMRNHASPIIGDYFIDAIEYDHLQSLSDDLSEKLVNYTAVMRYISKVIDHAVRLGLRKDNPSSLLVFAKKHEEIIDDEKEFENFYDKDELKAFLDAAKDHATSQWYTFFRLLAFTGMRKGEALALTWGDVFFSDKTITINKNLTTGKNNIPYVSTPKTRKSKRTIDMDQSTMNDLKAWRLEQSSLLSRLGFNPLNRDHLVFSTLKNTHWPLSNPNHRLSAIIKSGGLKAITVHGLRHTHCSMMFEAGATIPEIQKRLGHTDIQTTMNIYNHVSKRRKEEAVDKLVEYLAF